jgi:hypothetical protein
MIYSQLKKLIPFKILLLFRKYKTNRDIRNWEEIGRPLPPPHAYKQMVITNFQNLYSYNYFIETGTYRGDMVEIQKYNFKNIFSIELDKILHLKAEERFKNNNNIKIFNGDSSNILPLILKNINESAIFWLDGHYSDGITAKGKLNCPIFNELKAIFDMNNNLEHIILIDDARHFIGESDYPTIDELSNYITSRNVNYSLEVKNDIIRIMPKILLKKIYA